MIQTNHRQNTEEGNAVMLLKKNAMFLKSMIQVQAHFTNYMLAGNSKNMPLQHGLRKITPKCPRNLGDHIQIQYRKYTYNKTRLGESRTNSKAKQRSVPSSLHTEIRYELLEHSQQLHLHLTYSFQY